MTEPTNYETVGRVVDRANAYLAASEAGDPDRCDWPDGLAHIDTRLEIADSPPGLSEYCPDGGCPMSRAEFHRLVEWRERLADEYYDLATAVVAQDAELTKLRAALAKAANDLDVCNDRDLGVVVDVVVAELRKLVTP